MTDETVIHVTTDMRNVPMRQIAVLAQKRSPLSRNTLIVTLGLVAGLVFGLLLVARFGPLNYNLDFLRLLFPGVIAVLGASTAIRFFSRPVWDELQHCPYYDTPARFSLDASGINGLGTPPISWEVTSKVIEFDNGIAIFYTPVHYAPILDNALPAGMNRAALLQQISEWRAT